MCSIIYFHLFGFRSQDSSKVLQQKTHLPSYQKHPNNSRCVSLTSKYKFTFAYYPFLLCNGNWVLADFTPWTFPELYDTNCYQLQTSDILEMLKYCDKPATLSVCWMLIDCTGVLTVVTSLYTSCVFVMFMPLLYTDACLRLWAAAFNYDYRYV